MDANRKTAYHTLMDVETKQAYSQLALKHHIICSKPESPAFVRELVYGVLENKKMLDYIIEQLIETKISKVRTSDLVIMRMGLYQLRSMNSVPEYAAVSESVNLAKKFARGREAFVNAILRGYIKQKDNIRLPERKDDEVRYLSIKYSYEPWIVALWLEHYNAEFVEELLAAGNRRPPLTIRVNRLKTTKAELIKKLEDRGFEVKDGKICENALYIEKGAEIIKNPLYERGLFSVQDEASMLVSVMMDPKPGETVMDLCAAPGGKTFAIAERMQNEGKIISSDIYPRRLALIEQDAKRLGISMVNVRVWDATRVDNEMLGKADKVLVDAPCSGLGVLRRKPEIKYKKRTAEFDTLPEKQLAILEAAAGYVKLDGVLMYSTCTINPEENQKVVTEFLKKNNLFVKEEMVQLMPNVNDTDGFFICKMRKVKD